MITTPSDLPKGRVRLSEVLQRAGELISVADVSSTLNIDRLTAARLLSRWHAQGVLRRVRRGTYAAVPLTALGQDQVLEDPWVLVPELFGPAYVGGWSAAEHWGLTEQIFRDICVVTTRAVRRKRQLMQGIPFVLKHVRPKARFGTKAVWRGHVRVEVSTPAKTVIDMLDDPALGGGIRHVSECLAVLLETQPKEAATLIELGDQLGNGAVFKRLGYLLERRGGPKKLLAECRKRLTSGNAKLDPGLPGARLITRWNLWSPAGWEQGAAG